MKTIFLSLLTVAMATTFVQSQANNQKASSAHVVKITAPMGSYFKLVNDTPNNIRIHTGSGVVNLTKRGGSTSIKCNTKAKIYTAPNGTKKDFIFQADESMCDKTVKLSTYL